MKTQMHLYLRHKGNKSDTTPAPTVKHAFCVQYLTSHEHPRRSASMLDTSCLKSLPLPSCTTPFTAFPLLLLLMILTIVLSLQLMIFCFILFCFAELSEGENEQMHMIVCHVVTYNDLHMRGPKGPKLICMNQKGYLCLYASPLRVFEGTALIF